MSSEQTTALICFSSREAKSGSHVQLCLGTEGGGDSEKPFAFTLTVAKVTASVEGAAPANINITERIPLSYADIEKLRGWINLVVPR